MKVTLIQMNTRDDKAANLRQAESLIDEAVAADGPDLVSLPEMFTYLGADPERRRASAEPIPGGDSYLMLQDLAKRHGVILHGGSMFERDGDKVFNTTVVFDREGGELARYRKIHLFDVTTPDGREYKESAVTSPGSEVVCFEADGIPIGLTICYDLRFQELFQAVTRKGAKVIMMPAAFTLMTGKDHWEVLLRARAIETQTYVLAAGQHGAYDDTGRASFGHSLIVDPWGHVIARARDGIGFVSAHLDIPYLETIRAKIPVADHRVLVG